MYRSKLWMGATAVVAMVVALVRGIVALARALRARISPDTADDTADDTAVSNITVENAAETGVAGGSAFAVKAFLGIPPTAFAHPEGGMWDPATGERYGVAEMWRDQLAMVLWDETGKVVSAQTDPLPDDMRGFPTLVEIVEAGHLLREEMLVLAGDSLSLLSAEDLLVLLRAAVSAGLPPYLVLDRAAAVERLRLASILQA